MPLFIFLDHSSFAWGMQEYAHTFVSPNYLVHLQGGMQGTMLKSAGAYSRILSRGSTQFTVNRSWGGHKVIAKCMTSAELLDDISGMTIYFGYAKIGGPGGLAPLVVRRRRFLFSVI